MDHDHGSMGGGNTDEKASCPMIMVFHGGHCERILWKSWVASTMTEFVFSCLAFFAMAIIYEGLKFLREYLMRRTVRQETERMAQEMQTKSAGSGEAGGCCSNASLAEFKPKTYWGRIGNGAHLLQTLLIIVQVAISYLLMLVFMNFNYWLCLAVILGLGVGYFLFGWLKQDAYDGECCH